MTSLAELVPLVAQYRAGLEAEMQMLRRIEALAEQQHRLARDAAFDALPAIVEERDRLMAALVSVEAGLKPVRATLARAVDQLSDVIEFQQLVALHREAGGLARAILRADEGSAAALKEAEIARRAAAHAVEQGESTLAAYRRIALPDAATLVDRRG
jgi:hypothetical protein